MIQTIKTNLIQNIKNIYGWKTNRKFVVFSVDDYGNVRLDSKQALANMKKAGLKTYSRFDAFDTLESSKDLEALYDILCSVKDRNENSAIFTPYALTRNIDFERMESEDYRELFFESLPETYKKLESKNPNNYQGAWKLWQEGISVGLLRPQFHGREHLNIKTLEKRLAERDDEFICALKNRSMSCLNKKQGESNYTKAFEFQEFSENEFLAEVIKDGLKCFNEVFGYRASCFMPPSALISPVHHKTLYENGIRSIDTYMYHLHQYNETNSTKEFRWTGKQVENYSMIFTIRNAVFEPTDEEYALQKCKKMVEAAFRMRKPAIISSHRINFVGLVDEAKRTHALNELKKLLDWLIEAYPEVEFVSMDVLQNIIRSSRGLSDI